MKLYHNALPLLGLLSLSAAPLAAQQSAPQSAPSPAPAAAQDAAPRPKLVVVISIDQFSGNLFEEYRQTYAMGMKRLANGVVFPSGYQSHAATETCPGHSTITTGARPARTGIIANEWVDQGAARQDKTVYCAEDETVPGTNSGDYAASNLHLRVPTLGERMKAANPATRVVSVAGKDRAAIMMGGHNVDQLWWWGGNGFVSYRGTAPTPLVAQVNAGVMKLLGEAQPGLEVPAQCTSRDRAIALGGGKTVGTGHFARAAGDAKAFRASPEADAAVLVLATSLIEQMQLGKQAQTDIITIGLSANDYIGHTYGPGGAEMCIQQAQLDQSLGEFFARLDKDGLDYMVVLTADHGGLDLPERARENGAADAQRLDATLAPAAVNAALEQATGIKGLSARTLRALYNARNVMDASFRRDPANHAAFMQILKADHGQTHLLRLLNQTSVLGRYLWVFRRIVGQMQHDLFHVYTVDQHILMVVRNMRRFFIPEHAHEYPFCTQLAAEWDKPYLLYVAALFHDVAKGRGGDHSELGAVEVRRFCKDHGITGEDAQLVEFLVAEHLTMSRVAQKEDLSDPDVIQAFARRVGNERFLTGLYLLTVADIRGTSPKVWNAWKGKLLEDLFKLTLRALGGARPHLDAEIEARKQQARHTLALYFMPNGIEQKLWSTLDTSYFARHDAADIAWHTRMLWRHVETQKPVVAARLSPVGEGLQVLVYSPDRPDLFARICGYFDRAGFSIQDARIHTSKTGYAIDTFQILTGGAVQFEGVHYRDLIALVETQLAESVASSADLHEPSRARLSRRVKSFPVQPRVSLRPDERAQRWLLTVSASDRSGLLYVIARTLARHHINVQLAKVSTLGERVEDTFLVTGDVLRQDKAQLKVETELLAALES